MPMQKRLSLRLCICARHECKPCSTRLTTRPCLRKGAIPGQLCPATCRPVVHCGHLFAKLCVKPCSLLRASAGLLAGSWHAVHPNQLV